MKMKTKLTLAALLLSAVMVTPSYGANASNRVYISYQTNPGEQHILKLEDNVCNAIAAVSNKYGFIVEGIKKNSNSNGFTPDPNGTVIEFHVCTNKDKEIAGVFFIYSTVLLNGYSKIDYRTSQYFQCDENTVEADLITSIEQCVTTTVARG